MEQIRHTRVPIAERCAGGGIRSARDAIFGGGEHSTSNRGEESSQHCMRCGDCGPSLSRLGIVLRGRIPTYVQWKALLHISVALLFLEVIVSPVLSDYVFDNAELASTTDIKLPLPRPFDATACGLQHLAQQQQLMDALQQLHPQASRRLLQDKSLEVLYEAKESLVAEEVTLTSAQTDRVVFIHQLPDERYLGEQDQELVKGSELCCLPTDIWAWAFGSFASE